MSNNGDPDSGLFRLGTRKSALALTQSETVRQRLMVAGARCRLVEVVSTGDKDRETPLYAIEPASPGLFTKQLETALLANEIDLAVHSLKDLPTDQPSGLRVAAVPERVTSGDCLVARPEKMGGDSPLGLVCGAIVGTSSLRREAQLLSACRDLHVTPVRGNVPTRVQLVRDGKVDAVVLAAAGVARLGLGFEGLVKIDLSDDLFVSAPGQGALAVETRADVPEPLRAALATIHDSRAEQETRIERRILKGLFGGCTLPLGVRCRATGGKLELKAFLGIARLEGDRREWISFHHFDITEAGEDTLVEKTVAHFLPLLQDK